MKQLIACLLIAGFAGGTVLTAHAEETMTEKAQSVGRDAKRAAKKGMNRAQEAVCMEGDVKCAAEKAKNRAQEATDATVDKAKDIKESIDSN